ncbi:SGNH hydrolase [Penicillium taxi]|uniref:SGNH hydrolase n=1 Tax=Penicillium taxi TaxID=168475 RepID=UPI002544DE11|nr:SGNH hydrolase [Penicillium taxi]KAJ5893223.1 SGNH hydrolase [Penicillium taxi]
MTAQNSKIVTYLLTVFVLLHAVHGSVIDRRTQYTLNKNAITWNKNCDAANPKNKQETKRAAVERAWVGALELSSTAWNRFNTVTWPRIKQTQLTEDAQQYIYLHDPGPGKNGRPKDAELEISCADTWEEEDGSDACMNSAGTGSVAWTDSDSDEETSTINFCPSFWAQPRFDKLKSESAAKIQSRYQDMDYMGTDALVVIHELTHLWWIGPTNAEVDEVYGFVQGTELAWNCGMPEPNNEEVVENADTYAFYAEYGYWRAKGIDNLWPKSTGDPVYIPVENY